MQKSLLWRLLAASCALVAAPASAQVSFSDQTAAAGLTHTHTLDFPNFGNPMVAGGAVGDFDRDGWPDLFVLGGGGVADRLFINQGNGTFADQAAAWGVDRLHHGCGAVVADYDGDGWQDLYVTSYGPAGQLPVPGNHLLYHNNGDGTFTDVAAAAGVNYASAVIPDGYGAVFGDYDRDGDLDLFVAGWEWYSDGNVLFQNQGDGTFVNVTAAAGLVDPLVKGFVPTFADMDGDGWQDLLLISDAGTSRYFRNNGDGTFTRTGGLARFGSLNGMGCAVGDLDNDLDLDFYATSIYWSAGSGNALYWNQGGHVYAESAQLSGVDDGGWGWGIVAFDCDNDGWLDIAETNGWSGQFEDFPKRLYMNDRDRTFTETAAAAGIQFTRQGRGLIRWDYDRDGDEDLVFLANQDGLALYRNDGPAGHWLRLQLDTGAHPGLAPGGIGTQVFARKGSNTFLRYLEGGQSYLSSSEPVLHFGLGPATSVDELRVVWADGSETYLAGAAADQVLTVRSGLPLQVSELHRGAPAGAALSGARPGERVAFVYSLAGAGPGPSRPGLGGLSMDLQQPTEVLGFTRADAAGVARIRFQVPAGAPLKPVAAQAFVLRGVHGADSVKSNAVTRPVLP
ncbi:MAG: CRTAC1 family protein [Planctomycetota bacterium]|nr:MAG: CRTAC1 family protein [Planctomycetota bacterium]